MPELPEVETVRQTLRHQIIGETISKVNIYYDGIIKTDLKEYKSLLINETIRDILRYGKYLIFVFDHVSVLSHLRMEGKFFLKNVNDKVVEHEHIEWFFSSGKVLRYADTRKFGTMHLYKTTSFDELKETEELKVLGEEANLEFSIDRLYSLISKRSDPIKTALLDQSIICGLGNIYVDEVLFACKIHPLTPSNRISYDDCLNIRKYSNIILAQAISDGGTTIRSYTSSLGVTGRFQQHLMVHTLDGKKCINCNETIIKTRCGGRGTYLCPKCQRIKPMVYGITGIIGAGKSTISTYFKDKNYPVYDADKIVHDIYNEPDVIKHVVEIINDDILTNGAIDRKKLGNIVLNNKEKLKELESYIHPLVIDKVRELISNCNEDKIFFEVQLLFESNLDKLMSRIIYVKAKDDILISRVCERNNISYDEALKRVNAYNRDLDEMKESRSHFIIDNSRDLCYTYKQLDKIK